MATDEWKIKLLPPLFLPWEPKKELPRQIAVLMSGGVDSSVTAHLLTEQGWDVVGITMNIPVPCSPNNHSCCGVDAAFVRGVPGSEKGVVPQLDGRLSVLLYRDRQPELSFPCLSLVLELPMRLDVAASLRPALCPWLRRSLGHCTWAERRRGAFLEQHQHQEVERLRLRFDLFELQFFAAVV